MPGTTVGSSIPRVDGDAKVRGSALYVDDLCVPGVLHGATVRSTVPHGVLRAIHLDPGFDWSDVVVVTAGDIPGRNAVLMYEDDQPALVPVGGRIRHADEPVALVAAATRRRALDARQRIRLEEEELPAVLSLDAALAATVVLRGDDNVFKTVTMRHGGDIELALSSCDLVVEGEYRTPAQEQMYIEPQGMLAHWEGERCHVIGSLQCPYYTHKALKTLLNLGDHEVVVAQAVTGGAFGGKEEYPSMIAGHAALLARKVAAP
jgi:CO/xanthine dehydrogenase Mo-binding subunit